MSLTETRTDFAEYELNDQQKQAAMLLSPEQEAMLRHENLALVVALAEFNINLSSTGIVLNHPDYWRLRGRREFVAELLQNNRDARGLLTAAEAEEKAALQAQQNQS